MIFVLGMLAGAVVVGRGDIVLNAGQSYTHEFHIPKLEPLGGEVWVANAHYYFRVEESTFDPAVDEVVVEAFESSTNEVPFYSKTVNSYQFFGHDYSSTPAPWSGDLQGVLRISVRTGSIVLKSVSYGLIARTGARAFGGYDHSQIVPVPPPTPPPPVVVNEGESFTHEFHIPYTLPVFGVFWSPHTQYAFEPVPGTFDPLVDEVRVEAFENGTNEPPYFIATNTLTAYMVAPVFHWADRQGVLRLTTLKGSVALDSLAYSVVTREGSLLRSYSNSVALPFPEVQVRRSVAGQIGVRWPAGFSDWVLESAPEISPLVSWTTVTNARVRLDADWSVRVPLTEPRQFLRLRKIVEPVLDPF